jgi:hypothetical protein
MSDTHDRPEGAGAGDGALPYPGLARAIAQVLFAPTRLFTALRDSPRALPAILLVVAATTVFSLCLVRVPFTEGPGPLLNDIEESLSREEMTPEQRDQVMRMMSGGLGYASALIGPVATLAIVLAVAFVLRLALGVARDVSGAAIPSYRTLLALVAHVSLLDLVELLFKFPLFVLKGTLRVYTSPALVLPVDAGESALFKLLDAFDLFTIWKLVLLTIGLAIVARRTRRSAALLVGIPWALWVVVSVALSGVFAALRS